MFAANTIEAEVAGEITRWGGGTDMYFDMPQASVDGQIWNATIDPAMTLPADGNYPWGTILTDNDDWEELKIKKGFQACSNLHDFRFCAKLDAEGKQQWELEAYATTGGTEYFFHFYHNVPAGTNLFDNEPELTADYDVEATTWNDESSISDAYFKIDGKSTEGQWTFEIDPDDSKFDTWTWGETYKNESFDFSCCTKVSSSPVGTGKMTEVKTFTMTLDASKKITYLEAWFVWKEKIIHLHYGEAPSEKEDGNIELVSNDMKDATASGTDVYIAEFTAKDTKGRTWSFSFDPKVTSAEKHYPWGTTMTLADMADNMTFTYVKLDGQALTLDSLKLFMDLSDENGKPYLDATVWGKLGEQAYKVHVTANMPAPTTEITATSLTSTVLYNGRAELVFNDAAGNSVTIDFKESMVYFDQVYNYTSKQDSIVAISTRYNGVLEMMNYTALYDCWASFLVTKGEGDNISVTLRYKTNKDNKYKLTYTGAYTGSHIGYAVVTPDTVDVALPMAQAAEVIMLGAKNQMITAASADEKYALDIVLAVGTLLGEEGAPGKFTEADLATGSTATLEGQTATISTADITISKGASVGYVLEAYISSESVENKVFHFTTDAFGYMYEYKASMIKVLEDEGMVIAKNGDIALYLYFEGDTVPTGQVTKLAEGSMINDENITEAELFIMHGEEAWMISGMLMTDALNTYMVTLTSALAEATKTIDVVTTEGLWTDNSSDSYSWLLSYVCNNEAVSVEGTLFFMDYNNTYLRSYESSEITLFHPEISVFDDVYTEGSNFIIAEAKDITVAANAAEDSVMLTGTLLAVNEENIVYQFNLNIAGAYPKPAPKDFDNESEDVDSEEIGSFYISDIKYDEGLESTTYTAYTSDSAYVAQIVINDGEGTTPGGIDPLAVSEGVHAVSDDAGTPGVCVGGLYYSNPMGTFIEGSYVAELDAEGDIETPLWLFTEGLVLVQGEGDNLTIMVNAANSYGKFISIDLLMPKGPGTAIETVKNSEKAAKVLRNGTLIIRKGEAEYNVLGASL